MFLGFPDVAVIENLQLIPDILSFLPEPIRSFLDRALLDFQFESWKSQVRFFFIVIIVIVVEKLFDFFIHFKSISSVVVFFLFIYIHCL